MTPTRTGYAAGNRAGESGGAGPGAEAAALATDARTVALWTLVSRATGFARMATVAAVLGPTYFANLFQTTNLLPNVAHELLAGSLITAMLVPPLARHLEAHESEAARRLAGGFMGVMLLAFLAAGVLSVLAGPLLLEFITLGVGDAAVRRQQHQLGWPLLAAVMPQLLFYGIAATASAVQNARGRFALAAAAPALENVGVVAVMVASAALFGVGLDIGEVTVPQSIFLGVGCTAAVGLHAAAQWWGAYRAGVPLLPRAGWRDPEVRRVIRLAIPASGYTALNGASFLGLLVVAGSLPGGAVAFQIGFALFNLPVALGARPAAAAQLPVLSRSFERGDLASFGATYRGSLALTAFVALPAGLLFLAMPDVLARATSFGEMASPAGVALVAASIASLGPAIIGQSVFVVATSASYARREAVPPLQAMGIHAAVSLLGMAVALGYMEGTAVIWTIGLFFSAANLLAAAFLHAWHRRHLPAPPAAGRHRPLRDLAASAVAVGSGWLAAAWLGGGAGTGPRDFAAALLAVTLSGSCYLLVQWARNSDELRQLLGGFGRRKLGLGRAPGRGPAEDAAAPSAEAAG